MKRIFIFLTGLIVPFLLYSQGSDETKIRGNVYITRGADTLRIQQNGSYVDFYSTDPIRFNSTVYASALNATGITVSGASSFGSTVTGVTASPGDNSTKFATTAFVTNAVAGGGGGGGGTVTAVLKGNGMSFSDFTTSGTITLATPSAVTASSTNVVTTNSHTHQLTVPGTTGSILINNFGALSYDADFYYDIVHDGLVAPSGMIYDMYSDSIYIEHTILMKNLLSAPTTPTDEGYAYVYQDSFRFKNEAGTVFTLGVASNGTSLPDQSGHGGQFLATNGTSADWSNKIYTSGTAFYIDSTTSVNIRGLAGKKMAVLTNGGSVELYYNNSKKLQTEVSGVSVLGDFSITGGELFASDTSYFQSLISSSAFVGMELSPSLGTVNQGKIILSYGTASNGGSINIDGGFGSSSTGGVWLGSRDDGANWTSPVYVKTQTGSDSSLLVASTEYVDQAIYGVTSGGTIPTQSGHANEFLTTNGTATAWSATIGKDWYLHDNINLKFGTGADSYITYDGNNMVVGSYEGWQLYVDSTSLAILARPDSTVALYYAGVRSMETEPGGIKSDTVDAVKVETENILLTNALSGQIKLVDAAGSGGDLYIYGAGSSGADAGNVYMAAGTGTGVGSGGSVSIYAGDSVGVGGTYGAIILGSPNLGASYRNKTYIYTETDNSDSSNIAASTAFVKRLVTAGSSLPSMTGKAGKILMTDGGVALWSDTLGTNLTLNDNRSLRFGTSGAEGSWYSNGSSPIFKANSTAYFLSGTGENLATFAPNGAISLYYDNVAKFATSSGGVTITGNASITGNVALASGSDRQIYINGVSGEDLSIFAGAHLASGTAGSVFVYGGTSLGTNGNVWLGYTDAGSTELGGAYAKTQAAGNSTQLLATTAFVQQEVAAIDKLDSVLLNDTWFYATNAIGDTSGLFKLSPDNIIQFAYPIGIQSVYTVADAGITNIYNQPIVSMPYGDTALVSIKIDDARLLEVYARSDGAGSYIPGSEKVDVNGELTVLKDIVAMEDISMAGTFNSTLDLNGDLMFTSASDRAVAINGVAGEDLSIFAGAHLASGIAGSVFLYGGYSLGTNGNVWLGYTDAGSTSRGYAYAQTVALGDSTQKVATTAFVDRAVSGSTTTPGGTSGQFQYNSSGSFAGSSVLSNGTGKILVAGNIELYTSGATMDFEIYPTDYLSGSGTGSSTTVRGAHGTGFGSTGGAAKLVGGNGYSALGGNVYVYGGTGSSSGDVWLAHTDAGVTIRGSAYAPTVSQGDNSKKISTTAYVDRMVPSVTGNSGKYLYTNGSTTSWQIVTASSTTIPSYPHVANEINLANQFGVSYKKSVSQYTAMSSGNNNPHASLVVGNYFYVLTRTNPAILFRYSVDDFGTYTSCAFPTSTYYSSPEQMIYESSTGKIYIYFGYNSRISIVQVGTSSVTDTTTVVSYNTPAAQGSGPMISDGTYIYLTSNHYSAADSLYQYRISDWVKIASVRLTGNPTTYPHAMAYDGTRLFITTTSDTYPSYNKLYTATTATMAVGADSTPIYSYMSDDMIVAGDKLYIGKEDATGCIIVLDKSVSPITKDSIQTPVLSSCYGVFFDGGNIWATMAGSPGGLVKIDPYTSEVAYMTFPSGYNNTNELSIEGGRMFLTFYAAPFKLARLTLPKMTPAPYVKTSSSASTTYSLSAADNNKIIRFTSGSAITLTVPTGLPIGFSCTVMQGGAGQATFTASGTTISNRSGYTKTAGQYAVAAIVSISADTFITSGDMQ